MHELSLEDLPVGAVVLDEASAVVIAANGAASAVLRGSGQDLVGRSLDDLVAPDDRGAVADLLAGVDGDEHPSVVVALADPPARWVELTASSTGAGSLVALRDATEQVRTFRVLRESVLLAVVADFGTTRLWGPVGRAHPEDRRGEPTGALTESLHPEDASAAAEVWAAVASTPGSSGRLEIRARVPGTANEWGRVTFEVRNLEDVPEVGGLLLTIVDHTVEERVTSLARTRGSFLSIAEAAPVGIVLTGPRGLPIYFNEASQRLVPGVGLADERTLDWTSFVSGHQREEVRAWVDELVEEGRGDSRLVEFDAGEAAWMVVTLAPRVTEERTLVGFVITLQDVTSEIRVRQELEVTQERLVHLAAHDPLTGLANRSRLAEALDELRGGHGTAGEPSIGVLFADLDGFKSVNDRLGHHVGDEVLRVVADRLRAACPAEDLVVRLGGDEFLVLAGGVRLVDLAARRDAIVEQMGEPIAVDGGEVCVGVSVGTAMLEPGETVDELLRRADAEMYAHKSGRRADDVVRRRAAPRPGP